MSSKRERRWDRYGPLVKMAEADGWLLVRRPYCLPGAMSRREWDRLSPKPIPHDVRIAALKARQS